MAELPMSSPYRGPMQALRKLDVTPSGVAVEMDEREGTVVIYPYRRSHKPSQKIIVDAAELRRLIDVLTNDLHALEGYAAMQQERGTEFDGKPF